MFTNQGPVTKINPGYLFKERKQAQHVECHILSLPSHTSDVIWSHCACSRERDGQKAELSSYS